MPMIPKPLSGGAPPSRPDASIVAPWPTSVSRLKTKTCSWYVPAPTEIVEPGGATSTA